MDDCSAALDISECDEEREGKGERRVQAEVKNRRFRCDQTDEV